jgi:hypothetical protein
LHRPISPSRARKCSSWLLASWLVATTDVARGATAQELVLTLSNPISTLGRVSADFDEDRNLSADEEGTFHAFTLHPVFSIDLRNRFRLISDSVLSSSDTRASSETTFQQTFSLSPTQILADGFQWAAGAAMRFEGGGKWGLGPSVTLTQAEGNEVSGLTLAQIWSAAAENGDLSTLDAFTTWTRKGTAFTLRAQAAYDNRTGEMLVPIGIGLRRVFNTPTMGVSVDLRARYYLKETGRWGAGIGLTFTRRFAE